MRLVDGADPAGVRSDMTLCTSSLVQFIYWLEQLHRLTTFAPGFVPRAKFGTDLYPKMKQFANDIIARQ